MTDAFEKAYLREKQARLQAEKLLDEKTREVQSSIDMIQHQFNDLMQQKQESDFLLAITKLAQSDESKDKIVDKYLELNSEYLNSKSYRKTWYSNGKVSNEVLSIDGSSLPNIKDDIYKSLDGTKQPELWDVARVVGDDDARYYFEKDLHLILFIPITLFGKTRLICEFYFSEGSKVDSFLASLEAASFQLSLIIEGIYNKERLFNNYKEIKSSHEELKKAQSQLVQSEKMASLGQLAAGVAHEINNPIGFVMSNVGTLKEYSTILSDFSRIALELANQSESKAAQTLKEIDENQNIDFIVGDIDEIMSDCSDGLRRVKEIVANLKSFARSDDEEMAEIDINECIENTIKVVWNELKYKVTLHREFQQDLPKIKAHEGQIGQVIMNMLVNASHAIDERGDIHIYTLATESGVQIQIQDSGKGMSQAVMSKIFDPFFTTKGVSEGTGLGLSISYGIIESHGGTIRVESKQGVGTTFKIELPFQS